MKHAEGCNTNVRNSPKRIIYCRFDLTENRNTSYRAALIGLSGIWYEARELAARIHSFLHRAGIKAKDARAYV